MFNPPDGEHVRAVKGNGMLSVTATLGLASVSVLLVFISGILRQLGAADVAKGLIIFTLVAIVSAFAITYLPGLLLP